MTIDELNNELQVAKAEKRGADLSGANLSGADLSEANLIGANLRGANLRGADLREVIGNGREVVSLQTDIWSITYTSEVMQIGCTQHTIADWWGFTDDEIAKMEHRALDWWRIWKPILQQIITISPATPTGHKQEAQA